MPRMIRVSVSLPIKLYNQVKRSAKEQGVSLSEYCRRAVSWYLAIAHRRGQGKRTKQSVR